MINGFFNSNKTALTSLATVQQTGGLSEHTLLILGYNPYTIFKTIQTNLSHMIYTLRQTYSLHFPWDLL